MTPWMPACACLRHVVLFVVLLLAGCASEQPAPTSYPPLDFTYLPSLDLNVATIDVQSQYVPSGMPPDVSQDDPVPPVEALRLMATQRLKAVGAAGRAVFVIDDATLVRNGDTVSGDFSVTLNVYTSAGVRAGFALATVSRTLTNVGGDLRAALYTLTRQLMQQMNIEFEYQVRRSLHDWLVPAGPTPATLQQTPLAPPSPPIQSTAPPSTSLYPPPPSLPEPQPMSPTPPATSSGSPSPTTVAPMPPLPYTPPSGPLPEPTTSPPPPMPALPSPSPPTSTLPSPVKTPPPPSPALPAPLPPLGPVQD